MLMRLIGETKRRPGDDSTRVPINIDQGTRKALVRLLHEPQMRGVGYSEFIARAIAAAYEEIEQEYIEATMSMTYEELKQAREAARET